MWKCSVPYSALCPRCFSALSSLICCAWWRNLHCFVFPFESYRYFKLCWINFGGKQYHSFIVRMYNYMSPLIRCFICRSLTGTTKMARNLLKNPNGDGNRSLVSYCLSKVKHRAFSHIETGCAFSLDDRGHGILGTDGERWERVACGGHARRLWTWIQQRGCNQILLHLLWVRQSSVLMTYKRCIKCVCERVCVCINPPSMITVSDCVLRNRW